MVGRDGHIVEVNSKFLAFLEGKETQIGLNGRLRFHNPTLQQAFRRAVELSQSNRDAQFIPIPPTLWGDYLTIVVVPDERTQHSILHQETRALVTLVSHTHRQPDIRNLAQAYRFGPVKQSIIAEVARGLTPKEIAHRLGRPEGSVRVQLSAIYADMGVSGHAGLALLLNNF